MSEKEGGRRATAKEDARMATEEDRGVAKEAAALARKHG